MMARRRLGVMGLVLAAVMAAGVGRVEAWSHQGHILITRMAALRIINDANAPAGLRDFLKAHMQYDLEACHKLATVEVVGENPKSYQVGLDGAATWPDRVQYLAEGKEVIEPYGATESKMHFMDMEWLGKEPVYKADFSDRPKVSEVGHDYKDPRWKQAGYVPFRVEEFYGKVVKAFGAGAGQEADTLKSVGYLCHYIEDCHQPHHSTIDFKSYSYLAGKVAAVHKITRKLAGDGEMVDYMVDKKDARLINPHGDIEFQLFENADEPRKGLREEFWKELNLRIEKKAMGMPLGGDKAQAKAGSFTRALEILTESYDYLPAVGKAAVVGYASGKFNAVAFFTSKDMVHGEEMDTVQVIAERNACAVVEVERTLRAAWAEGKGN
jgi:hypothetical protein